MAGNNTETNKIDYTKFNRLRDAIEMAKRVTERQDSMLAKN